MTARGSRRLPPVHDEAPHEAERPPEPAIVSLQRAAGNAAVARLLARAPLATADAPRITAFRQSADALRAIANLAKPAFTVSDIGAANAWMERITTTLEAAKAIGDRVDLHYEGFDAEGALASEYSAAVAELPDLIRPVMERARETGAAISAQVMKDINESSVAADEPKAEPTLMPLDQAVKWREHAVRLQGVAGTFTTMGAPDAAAACQDAALAMLQARSVASARATWREGDAVESTVAQAKQAGRARNAVDEIFADSGFNTRQAVEKYKDKDGVEQERIFDWCGMFVAAGMFRGAALDKSMRMAFAHTDNVYDFFRYTAKTNDARTPLSIWAEGRWWLVSEYHQKRGSPRTWMEGSIDLAEVRPGDVALIRHEGVRQGKPIANHIVMVEAVDAANGKLVTVEGNIEHGIRPDAEGKATRQDGDLQSTAADRDSSVVHVRDMNDQRKTELSPRGAGDYRERGAKTVFGVGRPSLVDFEDHEYAKQAVPKALETTSPEEMRRKAADAARLQ